MARIERSTRGGTGVFAGTGTTLAATIGMLVAVAAAQAFMGRVAWCEGGGLAPWSLDINSRHNSQHLVDPYTLSHVQHGFLFFWGCWLAFRAVGVAAPRARFLLAVAIEASWELLENTPFIIERYREQTISLDYYGDSIVNSLADSLAMVAGYGLAAVLPAWLVAALFLAIEGGMLLAIRDSLTLNVIMLLHPIDAIRDWQGGLTQTTR